MKEEDEKDGSGDSGIELTTLTLENTTSEAKQEKEETEPSHAEEDEEAPIRKPVPRVLFNVSTRKRARCISIPPPESTQPPLSTTPSSDAHRQDGIQIPNGDTPHPPSSPQRNKVVSPSPSSPKSKKSKTKKHPLAPLEDSTVDSPVSECGTSSAIPPSPTTPTAATSPPSSSPRQNKHRSKQQHAQQDGGKSPPRSLSPARSVGLRA